MARVSHKKHISAPTFPFFYFLSCLLLYVLALPLLFASSLRPKHKYSLPARFFPPQCLKGLDCEPHLWFHACSFGEIRSLEPIIKALDSINHTESTESKRTILITTITHTGFEEATKLYQSPDSKIRVCVRYLPFEIFLPLWIKSCRHLQALIVTEAEMWKMLFYVGKVCKARTFLINARISNRSLKSYQRFKGLYASIFALIDEVLAQSQMDKERLEDLGAKHISVFGNLKTLNTPVLSAHYTKPKRIVFTAASTHRGEEKLILQAFQSLYERYQNTESKPLLLLAPRHPERFQEVYEVAQSFYPRTTLFSQTNLEPAHEVILINALGELNNLYAISDVVMLGGSFVQNVGGHNPLEPAFFRTKLISGEHIFNQYALFEAVTNYVLIPPQSLKDTLLRWEQLPQSACNQASSDKLSTLIHKITHT